MCASKSETEVQSSMENGTESQDVSTSAESQNFSHTSSESQELKHMIEVMLTERATGVGRVRPDLADR